MNKVKLFLPWLGEFGSELIYWIPAAYAYRGPKIVCYEEGKECLYPADWVYTVERVPQHARKTWGAADIQQRIHDKIVKLFDGNNIEILYPIKSKGLGISRKWFVPKARDHGFKCDVVIFPRWRNLAPARNFKGWPVIVETLKAMGLEVFIGGTKDMSFDLGDNVNAAWHYEHELEATIHAITHSNVRFGTPTGAMLLSLMCGKPVLAMTTPANKATDNHFKTVDHLGVGWSRIHLDDPENETGKAIDAICSHARKGE